MSIVCSILGQYPAAQPASRMVLCMVIVFLRADPLRYTRSTLLGGLRRCEVLGLQLTDLRVSERRLFIANGKGGHQRLIPVSSQFFTSVAAYLDTEQPAETNTEAVVVVLKGPHRGSPLSAACGVPEVVCRSRTLWVPVDLQLGGR